MAISIKSKLSGKKNIKIIPLVTLREGVIFPSTEAVLTFGRPTSIVGVQKAVQTDSTVCFVSQKKPNPKGSLTGLYTIGTICSVIKTLPINNELHAIVRGITRVKILNITEEENRHFAAVAELTDVVDESDDLLALSNHLVTELKKAITLGKANIDVSLVSNQIHPIELSHQVSSILNISNQQKQKLLEQLNVYKRLKIISEYLSKEIQILQLEFKIATRARRKFDKETKEAVLRERMRTIQKELGEGESSELDQLAKKIAVSKMPKEAKEKTTAELKRLRRMSSHNPESGYIRTWIETMVDLPWGSSSKNHLSLTKAEKILNNDHFGLDKVKERIIEYIAVLKLKSIKEEKIKVNKSKKSAPPAIICFVGPPGVGKTSVGRSIAKALGRKFVRISLGGIRDEAEIRGHRRTYVGSMPGRIIQAVKESKTDNPIFMLDEIDKIGADYRGDPSAALLEVLDPEQNFEFRDHYLDVPFDLSRIMFITTANRLDTIPGALRDRLEIINFSGYTEDEKVRIAKKHLLPKQLLANGLDNKQIKFTTPGLHYLARFYTREAGVRGLERQIASLMRKAAKKIAISRKKTPTINITPTFISKSLGPKEYDHTLAEDNDQVGICTGLAYTQTGGDIIFIETVLMHGKGHITLTGQLGDVMKESAQAAYSYVRSQADELKIDPKIIAKTDIHIHVPEGATPKDGPSAGVAITIALISAFTKRPLPRDIAMTGEVTLRGRILGIGGLKEKVIAAHRAGIKTVIIPKENKKNIIDIPNKVKKDIKLYFFRDVKEVSKVVFGKKKQDKSPKKT